MSQSHCICSRGPWASGAGDGGGGPVPTACRAEDAFQDRARASELGTCPSSPWWEVIRVPGTCPCQPLYQLSDFKRGR